MPILKMCRCKLKSLLEVLLMSLIIAIAVLLLIASVYVMHLLSEDKNNGDDDLIVTPTPTHSYKTRVAGLIEKIYPDENNHNQKLLCNGLIVEKQTVIVLADCFRKSREKKPTKHVHFITSGSKYWNYNRNVHLVTSFSTIETAEKSILVLKVWPDFPLTEMGLPNKISVENEYKSNEEHRVWGWDINSKKARDPMKNVLYSEKCNPDISSGILLTKDYVVSGLHYVYCNSSDSGSFVKFPSDEIGKNYPEIHIERVPKQNEARYKKFTKLYSETENTVTPVDMETNADYSVTGKIPTTSLLTSTNDPQTVDQPMVKKITLQVDDVTENYKHDVIPHISRAGSKQRKKQYTSTSPKVVPRRYNTTIEEDNCADITEYSTPKYLNIMSSFITMPTVGEIWGIPMGK